MGRRSAGVLLFRRDRPRTSEAQAGPLGLSVLLGHMGGPFHAHKDAGAWSIPKGEFGDDEAPIDAARREFTEELGLPPPQGDWLALGTVRQAGGKTVHAWAVEADLDPATVTLGTFEMEWPPRSGRRRTFAELDRVAWFGIEEARTRMLAGQVPLLDRLEALLQCDEPLREPRSALPSRLGGSA